MSVKGCERSFAASCCTFLSDLRILLRLTAEEVLCSRSVGASGRRKQFTNKAEWRASLKTAQKQLALRQQSLQDG